MAERLIHILPEHVASQIAAGEVVERPASALKELIDNALDAGAGSIRAEVERGGCDRIFVGDDGCGMEPHDATLSLRRHATSKIRDASDLAAIRTLGFRGEALAAIASVTELCLRTRRPSDPNGIELCATGGEVQKVSECAMAPGTMVEAKRLFFNTPARLKFLKSPASEQAAVAETLQRLALANHRIAFSLICDGRVVFDLARTRSLLERARQLFGPKLADTMVPFELARSGMRTFGLASMSQTSFPTSRMVMLFVNTRPVRDRALARAVVQAYQTLLPRNRYPAAIVFLEVAPAEVDVNVHPMKSEVRFRRSGAVFEIVYDAIRSHLAQHGVAAAPLPAGLPVPHMGADDASRAGVVEDRAMASQEPAKQPFAGAERGAGSDDRPLRLVADAPYRHAMQRPLGLGFRAASAPSEAGAAVAPDVAASDKPSPVAAVPAGANIPLYSQLRLLGQLFLGYVVLEDDDGLLLVDQHAAHERVTFERLRRELREGGVEVQSLLTPVTIELNPAQAAHAEAALPQLRAVGFELETFGPTTLLLKGAPAVFGAGGAEQLLRDLIESIGNAPAARGGESAFETLLRQLACHGSVRVGRVLSDAEIHALLADLDRTQFKATCPHGRPVHIRFARGQIERMFRR